ncbi:hypothetical protein POF50_033125 [Streptomyces sp. SL13]|uniref:Uncharacterized protein n=1 Tax=Streptantibioticus silvisoli TaxID=2705255 RepID=A0AA90HD10_9ACTN|nr:hypothetical protein [Streptantibioticus silvisoli]MDI5964143.1 hypothetical protein [Streptantibioticus silvisoli]MDI5974132.1 hypothetical protein [Streptantibioticus silvisoli]
MSFAGMVLAVQGFAAVFAVLGVVGMFSKRNPPSALTRFAPFATLLVAVGLLVFAVALREHWIHVR